MKLPRAVPNNEMRSTGLRPMRSDSRPRMGEKTNWAAENAATSSPTSMPLAPKRSAYRPRIGTTMPNPIRSSATVVQITQNPAG